MANNLKDVIYISNEDYAVLAATGTVVIGGTTLTYDENNLYITPDGEYLPIAGGTLTGPLKINAPNTSVAPLHITGVTNATMTYGTTNPRIQFSDSVNGQAVGIVYTDYDSYRASKGLKVMDLDNSDTGNVWLEVQGKIYENGYALEDRYAAKTHIHGNITNDGKLGTASRVVVTDSNKIIATSNVTLTELGYLSGVTSAIQTQLNGKAPTSHASDATTYGVGTQTNYGHIKLLTGDMNGQSYSDGIAASINHTHSQYLTGHQSIKTLNTNVSTAQSVSSSETITGTGSISLHKIAKTGTYSDLIGTPTIGNGTLTIQTEGTPQGTFTANATGNVTVNITAADLGLSSAIKFIGTTTTAISDGSTTNPITINGSPVTAVNGNVVLYGNKEFLWNGSLSTPAWEELGDESSYALKSVTITGTGVLGGGGSLEANRTITHNQVLGTAQTTSALYKTTMDAYGHISAATAAVKADITDLLGDYDADTVDGFHINGIANMAFSANARIQIGAISTLKGTKTYNEIINLSGVTYGSMYKASDQNKYYKRNTTNTSVTGASYWNDVTEGYNTAAALPNQQESGATYLYIRVDTHTRYYQGFDRFFIRGQYDNTSGGSVITGLCRDNNKFDIQSYNYNGNKLVGIYQPGSDTDIFYLKFTAYQSTFIDNPIATMNVYTNVGTELTLTYISPNDSSYSTVSGYSYIAVPTGSFYSYALGNRIPQATNAFSLGTASRQWNAIYGKTLYENGTALSSAYVTLSTTQTISGIKVFSNSLVLDNGIGLYGKDSNGYYRNLIYVSSANNIVMGDTALTGDIRVRNNLVRSDDISTTASLGLSDKPWVKIYGTTLYENGVSLANTYAPISHASSGNTYGVGTETNYGHIKLVRGDLNGATYSDGVAASVAHTHSQYITGHQSIKSLNTTNTTAQSTNASEAISGSGTVNLHKVSKTGTYSDLIGKPQIERYI